MQLGTASGFAKSHWVVVWHNISVRWKQYTNTLIDWDCHPQIHAASMITKTIPVFKKNSKYYQAQKKNAQQLLYAV